jgi:hypothetical protein
MRLSDALDMQGRLTIQAFNRRNESLGTFRANNSIVYTGRDLVAKLFVQEPIDPIRYIAIGTGGKPVDPNNDTQLQNEIFRKELKAIDLGKDLVDISPGSAEQQRTHRKIRLSADLDFEEPKPLPNGQPHELREAGLFNAESGGVMYNRVQFPGISKTKDFKLTLIWDIIF